MFVKVACVIGITVIECYALYKGRDGKLLTLALALIGGIGGYSLGAIY